VFAEIEIPRGSRPHRRHPLERRRRHRENGALLLESVSDNPYRGASGKLWRRTKPYDQFMESCIVR
jgi:hypothetical protein